MMKSLVERVTEFVVANPALTLPEIARGVTARDQDVRDVLSDAAFSASGRDPDEPRSPQVYRLAPNGADGLGLRHRRTQCDLIAAVLNDGDWHTTSEIHRRCGFSRLNSRISEMRRRRHMVIECRHVDGQHTGPNAFEYRFVGFVEGFGPSGEATQDGSIALSESGSAATLAVPSSASPDGSASHRSSPDAHLLTEAGPSDEQIGLDEAA